MMDLNQYQKDFLWVSYFGIMPDDAEKDRKKAMGACINRAYKDLCRTLRFTYSTSWLNDSKNKNEHKDIVDAFTAAKKAYKSKLYSNIIEWVKKFLNGDIKENDFDSQLISLCENIKDESNNSELSDGTSLFKSGNPFTFGHAQKWVNMALKYMLVMGCWDELNNPEMYKLLHVPVDQYVLDAAHHELGMTENYFGCSWSRITSGEKYLAFQNDIRAKANPLSPIEWEGKAWADEAARKSQKEDLEANS